MTRHCSDREMLVSKETGVLATCLAYSGLGICWWDEWDWSEPPPWWPECWLPEWRTYLEPVVCNRSAERTAWEVTPTGFCLGSPPQVNVNLDSEYCGGQDIPYAVAPSTIPPGKGGWLFFEYRTKTQPGGPH